MKLRTQLSRPGPAGGSGAGRSGAARGGSQPGRAPLLCLLGGGTRSLARSPPPLSSSLPQADAGCVLREGPAPPLPLPPPDASKAPALGASAPWERSREQ